MASVAQKKAVLAYRGRLSDNGMVRTEIVVAQHDKALLHEIAQVLAKGGDLADRLRLAIEPLLAGPERVKGGIYAMLRDSPLVESGIVIDREPDAGREIEF